jgi:Protein of unknown function (DUF1761)
MKDINIWAVLVAAASSFLLGGFWYSKSFLGGLWNREAGRSAKPGEGHHPARVFGLSFLFSVIAAAAFALWIGPNPPLGMAVMRGLVAGSCFVAASFGVNYQFASRSTLMWLIDGGYHTAQFVLFGLVLGLWH